MERMNVSNNLSNLQQIMNTSRYSNGNTIYNMAQPIGSLISNDVDNNTLYVSSGGYINQANNRVYGQIQQALDTLKYVMGTGRTWNILVFPGRYESFTVDTTDITINIIGQNKNDVIIEGGIRTENTTVHIQNVTIDYNGGIMLTGSNSTITYSNCIGKGMSERAIDAIGCNLKFEDSEIIHTIPLSVSNYRSVLVNISESSDVIDVSAPLSSLSVINSIWRIQVPVILQPGWSIVVFSIQRSTLRVDNISINIYMKGHTLLNLINFEMVNSPTTVINNTQFNIDNNIDNNDTNLPLIAVLESSKLLLYNSSYITTNNIETRVGLINLDDNSILSVKNFNINGITVSNNDITTIAHSNDVGQIDIPLSIINTDIQNMGESDIRSLYAVKETEKIKGKQNSKELEEKENICRTIRLDDIEGLNKSCENYELKHKKYKRKKLEIVQGKYKSKANKIIIKTGSKKHDVIIQSVDTTEEIVNKD